jgi:AcrR family transcriptional regulator
MGRPPNPARRGELLDEIVDYVLERGLVGLSLRPLAKALGVSTYTLTYQLGPKDEMMGEIVKHAERRLAAELGPLPETNGEGVLGAVWSEEDTDAGHRWTRLLVEVAIASEYGQVSEGQGLLEGRLDRIGELLHEGDEERQELLATLANALVLGLAIDRGLTHDDERISKSLRLAEEILGPVVGHARSEVVADLTERPATVAPR